MYVVTVAGWLQERLENLYKKDPGYSDKAASLFTLDLQSPQELPDNLRGEQWNFVQLPLSALMDELKQVKQVRLFILLATHTLKICMQHSLCLSCYNCCSVNIIMLAIDLDPSAVIVLDRQPAPSLCDKPDCLYLPLACPSVWLHEACTNPGHVYVCDMPVVHSATNALFCKH